MVIFVTILFYEIIKLLLYYKIIGLLCKFALDDGVIAAEEYRYNAVSSIPVHDINALDEAYQNLLNVRLED